MVSNGRHTDAILQLAHPFPCYTMEMVRAIPDYVSLVHGCKDGGLVRLLTLNYLGVPEASIDNINFHTLGLEIPRPSSLKEFKALTFPPAL